jgi:ATP-dependent Lon protease
MSNQGESLAGDSTERVAILPLRNSVLFPMSVVPINVGRPRSVRLVEELAGQERALVGVVTQRDPDTVEPAFGDLYEVGTLARVVKVIRLGQSNYSVVLNGLGRFRVGKELSHEPYMQARIDRIRDEIGEDDPELDELSGRLRDRTRTILDLMPDLPRETPGILDNVHEPGAHDRRRHEPEAREDRVRLRDEAEQLVLCAGLGDDESAADRSQQVRLDAGLGSRVVGHKNGEHAHSQADDWSISVNHRQRIV